MDGRAAKKKRSKKARLDLIPAGGETVRPPVHPIAYISPIVYRV